MTSPLDTWAQTTHKKEAIGLNDDQMDDLVDYVKRQSDEDVKYWQPRNDRMLSSQSFWEMQSTEANLAVDENTDTQVSEEITLNDGYLIVDKITSMVASAGWRINVPSKNDDPGLDQVAQNIEDLLYWAEDELNAIHGLALNSTLIRDEVHYAVFRGWICGLITPDLENPEVPWSYLLEDPLLVYPRYSRNKLVRVVHRYNMSVLEARYEYPQCIDYLADRIDDDELIEITTYYDDRYKMCILDTTMDVNNGNHLVIHPLAEHGYMDINGKPMNPWIIVTPRGTPSRHIGSNTIKTSEKEIIAMIGLDVLHPVKSMIRYIEKLASQLHTEVAKSINPPRIVYYDGVNPPERLDLGIGGENYMVFGTQDAKIVESTAMKPDGQALMQLLTDRLQRGSVPSVLYGGEGVGALSGFAISLLSQGAKDVVSPILEGVKLFRQLRFRRMLELYVSIGADVVSQLAIRSTDPLTDKTYTGQVTVSAEDIKSNGVFVDVTYDDVTPQDKVSQLASVIAGVQSGLISPYDAHKDWLKTRSPAQAIRRSLEALNYQDPEIRQQLAIVAGERSSDPILQEAIKRVKAAHVLQEQMMAQAGGQNAQGSPASPVEGMPTQTLPTQMQPGEPSMPSAVNPIQAATAQMNNAGAQMNVGNGATPPSPGGQALSPEEIAYLRSQGLI